MTETKLLEQLIEILQSTLLSSGRNKEPDDFTILHEYINEYGIKPSVLRINNEIDDFFKFNQLIDDIKLDFPESSIIYTDQTFSLKHDLMIIHKVIIKLKNQYMVEITTDHAEDLLEENKYLELELEKTDELVTDLRVLTPPIADKKLVDKIVKCFRKSNMNCENKRISIEMVAMDRGEFYTENFYLDESFVDMKFPDLHYGNGFEEFYDKLLNKLRTDTKGLVLLHGDPGTGKTYFLRQLLKDLTKKDARILYFSPTMVGSITDPTFINFITKWANENEIKKGILLIEDAEPLLETRNSGRNIGITNLLNLTDGLLNDILKIQIIATFNMKIMEIDDALIRPERLIARKEFKKLSKEDIYKLIESIEIPKEKIDAYMEKKKTKEMTLAEIYSLKNENEIIEHNLKKSIQTIGYKTSPGFKQKN